jgi:hypothetical protein
MPPTWGTLVRTGMSARSALLGQSNVLSRSLSLRSRSHQPVGGLGGTPSPISPSILAMKRMMTS